MDGEQVTSRNDNEYKRFTKNIRYECDKNVNDGFLSDMCEGRLPDCPFSERIWRMKKRMSRLAIERHDRSSKLSKLM